MFGYCWAELQRCEKNIPEAAIDDEEDGDQERWHLTGVDQGIRPGEEEKEVYNYGFKK